MADKGKPFAQDGFVRTPRLANINTTQGEVTALNGYRPTPTVATAQGQSQKPESGGKE